MQKTADLEEYKVFPLLIYTSMELVKVNKAFQEEFHYLFGEYFEEDVEFLFVSSLLRVDYKGVSAYEGKLSLAIKDNIPILSCRVFDASDKGGIIEFMSLPVKVFQAFEKKILLFSGLEMDNEEIERTIKEWNRLI